MPFAAIAVVTNAGLPRTRGPITASKSPRSPQARATASGRAAMRGGVHPVTPRGSEVDIRLPSLLATIAGGPGSRSCRRSVAWRRIRRANVVTSDVAQTRRARCNISHPAACLHQIAAQHAQPEQLRAALAQATAVTPRTRRGRWRDWVGSLTADQLVTDSTRRIQADVRDLMSQ